MSKFKSNSTFKFSMNPHTLQNYLRQYLKGRPLFLSLIRAKEAAIFHDYLPLRGPILDVGCGDGYFTRIVFGSLDVGLDIADSRIGQSTRDGGYKKTIVYDGRVMPCKKYTFPTIVSNCVLEHIPNVDTTIREMSRVLTKDGRVLVTVMAKPWEDHLFGALFLGNSYRSYMRQKQVHVNMLTDAEWRKKFAGCGLRVTRCVGYLTPMQCQLIDIAHYLSVPSLISYVLTKRWVLIPALCWYPVRFLSSLLVDTCTPSESGAIFYELQKK